MTSGIYLITNKLNNMQYVGQSVNIEDRLYRHSITDDNCYLHNAIKKYGWKNFKTQIIECCEPDRKILNEREIYYIEYFNTLMPNGYNMTKGGNANSEHIKKKVKQYDLEGIYIQTFSSIKEASIATGIDSRYISDVANHNNRYTAKSFQWCFEGEEHNIQNNPKNYSGYEKIPVCQYDLKGQYIKTIESLSAAAKQVRLSDANGIKKCCETKGNYSAGGYQWRYLKDKTDWISPYNSQKAHSTTSKPVEQYNKQGIKIAEFNSAKEAADSLNMKKGGNAAILRVCQGKQKTCMGFIWKYKELSNG